MGLMDKFKNLFTDEEIIEEEDNEEIEIKEIKKDDEEHKLPTFMREKIEREKQEDEKKQALKKKESTSDLKDDFSVKELKVENDSLDKKNEVLEKSTFKFPINLEDNDFIETRSRQAIHNNRDNDDISRNPRPKERIVPKKEVTLKKETKVSELYKDKREDKKEDKKFRATPIISPIYGVLDQNYTSLDVESKKGNNLEHHRHSKNVDFDSVRKKAYGNLAEEIKENLMCENCEYLKEAKECQKEKERKLDALDDKIGEECSYYEEKSTSMDYDNVTLDEASENYYDYGVSYDKLNYVKEDDDVKIVNHEEEEVVERPKKDIPPVKSSINLLSTLKKSMGDDEVIEEKKEEKNLELTDDLFNLIDSMYDERKDGDD